MLKINHDDTVFLFILPFLKIYTRIFFDCAKEHDQSSAAVIIISENVWFSRKINMQ